MRCGNKKYIMERNKTKETKDIKGMLMAANKKGKR